MKALINILFTACLLLAAFVLPTACSDWTDSETVDLGINSAKDQNPELWARYMQILHTYKQSKHYVTYVRFDNALDNPVNEGGYLRSLPDSLDIVTLSNPDKATTYDKEDMVLLKEKSTRILYLVDYAAQSDALSDVTKLGAYLDKAIASASELGLDGFAFTGNPLYSGTDGELAAQKEKARLIVSKLSAATGEEQLLVFEGDPAFVDVADMEKLDYIVLNTADLTNITDLKLLVTGILADGTAPKDKLILSATMGEQIIDGNNAKQDAVPIVTDYVVSLGPLGGLGIYSISNDYYNPQMNYETTRTAIQQMNPAQ